jgi:hypothetical protein
MALGDLYDRFQALLTMDHRVRTLEEQMRAILPRLDEVFLNLVRLDGRIDTMKAETLTEFYRGMAGGTAPSAPTAPGRPALPPPRMPRRPR